MTDNPISSDVWTVCNLHHKPAAEDRCAGCPIREVCHSGPKSHPTHASTAEWRRRMNSAAADWINKHKGIA